MTTSRTHKLILGASSVVPTFVILGATAYIMAFALMGLPPVGFAVVIGLTTVMTIALLATMAYFTVHALSNAVLTETGKGLWVLLLLKAGLFSLPIYWYRYIWQRAADRVSGQEGSFLPEARVDVRQRIRVVETASS